jgi:sec-independent protein translocase protein TatB
MFDLGAAELLVIVIVAIVVIGPKDMPAALRAGGRWIGKIRKVSTHFRTGLDAMVREAELEDMEKQWKAQNDAIMARSGDEMTGPPIRDPAPLSEEPAAAPEGAASTDKPVKKTDEPQLPLDPAGSQSEAKD